MIKPLFSDDPRGPWELIWHRFLDIANAFHLEDRYILYVYGKGVILVHLRLDLVNLVVRPLLFTKSSLFTKLRLDKEENMRKGAGDYTLN